MGPNGDNGGWMVVAAQRRRTAQTAGDTCFAGGKPRIPPEVQLPRCAISGHPMSFFFQVGFPESHVWAGHSLAVFATTDYFHYDHVIPARLEEDLRGVVIPDGFLRDYQTNFRLLVFETMRGVVRESYRERVAFRRWELGSAPRKAGANKLGGAPDWYANLGDEAPASYHGEPMVFLMQLAKNHRFPLVPTAPRQVIGGTREHPERSVDDYYELFIGRLFFFGTAEPRDAGVYVVTQS